MNKSRVFIPVRLRPRIEARSRWSLSHVHVHTARKQGMNPNKLGELSNRRQGRWKLPLPDFIARIYIKRIGKMPNVVKTVEEVAWPRWDARRGSYARAPPRIGRRLQSAGHSQPVGRRGGGVACCRRHGGIHSVSLGPLPDVIAKLMATQVSVKQLALEAAVHASKELALRALLIDPVINSEDAARGFSTN